MEARDKGEEVNVVYVDFSKAFDKVPHAQLLRKVRAYGINEIVCRWISDFLIGRTFAVRVEETVSEWQPVPSGVPQGSVLGPLLFLVYINDLPDILQIPCLIYADDVKLWTVGNTDEDCDRLQHQLDRLWSWTEQWKMPINLQKCCYMHIGRIEASSVYNLGGDLLRQASQERDLGVMVSSSLRTWENTQKACASARGILGAIRRSFTKLTKRTFSVLFSAHVRPRLEYASSAVYPCTMAEKNLLERVQRSATKLVEGLSRLPYNSRLKELDMFPQSYRRIRGDIIFLRKIMRGELGDELQQYFPLRDDPSRRGHRFIIKKQRAQKLSDVYRLSRRVVNHWNSLPADVVDEDDESRFKVKLDQCLQTLWRQ